MNLNRILRRIIYACLGGIVVLPFAPVLTLTTASFSTYFPYITPGGFIFRALALIAFGAWVMLAIRDGAYRPKRTPLSISMLAFVIVIALANTFGVDRIRSFWSNFERMEGFVTWSHLIMLFYVAAHTIRFKAQWAVLATSSWLVAVVSAIAAFIINDGIGDDRISGLFGNPIYFAIYMLIHVYIAAYGLYCAYRDGKTKTVKAAALAASIIVFSIGIVLSGTRGTYIAYGVSLFAAALVLVVKEKKSVVLKRVSIALITLVVLGTAFLFAVRNNPTFTQFQTIERASSVFDRESNSIFARINNWRIALDAFKERPILGWGQENYIYPFASHHNPNMYGQEPWFDRTHNVVFDWLVAAGLLGLLAYLAVLVSTVAQIWRSQTIETVEQAVLIAIIVAYVIHNIFVFDYLLSAVALMLVAAYVQSRSAVVQSRPKPVDTPVQSDEYFALTVLSLATLIGAYLINVPALRTSVYVTQAMSAQDIREKTELFEKAIASGVIGRSEAVEQFTIASMGVARAQNIPDQAKLEFRDVAGKALAQEVAAHPDNVRTLTFYGSFLLNWGDSERAVEVFERARALAPRRQANLMTLSSAYSIVGRTAEAVEVAKVAYELQTDYDAARLQYVAALIGNAQSAEANALITEEDKTNPELRQDLIGAYLRVKQYAPIIELLKPAVAANPSNIQDAISLSAAYLENKQRPQAIAVLVELKKYITDENIMKDLDSFIASIRAGKDPIVR